MALPPVCAAGLFHYTLLISPTVLQTALNVSSCGHQDSVSIIGIEAATVNQELIASCGEGKEDELGAETEPWPMEGHGAACRGRPPAG